MPASRPPASFYPSDPRIGEIARKVFAGDRLSDDDGIELFRSKDLSSIGYLANWVREKHHGNSTTFSVNRHINYSNICMNECSFCAFRKKEGADGAERLSIAEITAKVREASGAGPVEIHITGALDPCFMLDEALMMISEVRSANPLAVIKAFTLVEVDYFAAGAGLTPEEVMQKLKNAGVSAFPGGGAEIFSRDLRKRLCPEKITGERWLDLARLAHSLGIRTNATMLYGVGESHEDRLDHLLRLRDLQDRTGGFMAFIPLLFQKENTALKDIGPVGASEQLRVYAVSRLILDNVAHIKVHWAMSGMKIAEIAQWFGVDDVEGTVVEERIGHEGGARTHSGLTKSSIISLIERSGRIPAERDGLYNPVKN